MDKIPAYRLRILVSIFTGLLVLLFAVRPASAEKNAPEPPPATEAKAESAKLGVTREGSTDLIGTENPLGIKLTTGLDYKDSYAYSSTYDMVSGYWAAGGELGVTPAYMQPAIHIEWMPWVIAILNVEYSGYYFFGANEGLLSFSSAQQPFGDDVLRARSGTEETGWAWRLMVQPTLQFKIGSVTVRNQTDYAWYRFHGTGPYYLELDYDILLKSGDRLFANRTQVLGEISAAGGRSTLAGPFFEIVHGEAADLTSRRLGLLFYSEQGPQLHVFKTTRYYGELAYYLSDPNRAHGFYFLGGIGGDFGLK